jgi:hypothetical protein
MFEFLNKGAEEKLLGGKNSYAYLAANYERLGIPNPALTLKAPLEEFDAAYAAAKDKNTGKAATVRKEAAEKAFNKAFRDYGNQHMAYNPVVTDVDKAQAGYHVPKGSRAPVPRPTTKPEITADTRNEREITFGFRETGAKKMGKPAHIDACVFRWLISDHEPTDISELVNIDTITKSPFTLMFKESDRGKRLYFVACWQIERGRIEGPMTDIRFSIIP